MKKRSFFVKFLSFILAFMVVFTSFDSSVYGAARDVVNVSVDGPYGVMPVDEPSSWSSLPTISTTDGTSYYKITDIASYGANLSNGADMNSSYANVFYNVSSRVTYEKKISVAYGTEINLIGALNDNGAGGSPETDLGRFYWCAIEFDSSGYCLWDSGWLSTSESWVAGVSSKGYDRSDQGRDIVSYIIIIFRYATGDMSMGAPSPDVTPSQLSNNLQNVYLCYKPFTYTVDYAGGNYGGASSSTIYRTGISAVSLPTPSRTGYTFTGYYIASPSTLYPNWMSGNTYSVETLNYWLTNGWFYNSLFANTVFTAQWSANSYTMTSNHYVYNPQTGGFDYYTTTYDTALYDSTYTPSYTSIAGYSAYQRDWNDGWPVSGDGTFSVYYYPNTHTMTSNHYLYDHSQGGYVHWKSTTASALYNSIYVPAYATPPQGYSAYNRDWESGWPVSSDASFAVRYHPNNYTVTFNANGASTPTASKGVTYTSTYGTLPTPTRTGYTFNGWYTALSGGSRISDSTKVSTAGNHTLYARWTINSYKVTYNANGGTTSATTATVNYNSAVNLSPTASKSGYTFVGWATSPDDKMVLSSYKMPANNVTLYALYTIDVSDVANHDYPSYNKVKDLEVYLAVTRSNGTSQLYPLTYTKDAARMTYQYMLNSTNVSSFTNWAVVAYDNAGNWSKIGGTAPPQKEYYKQTVDHYKYVAWSKTWEWFDIRTEDISEGSTYTPKHITPPAGYTKGDIDSAYKVTANKVSKAYYNPNSYTLYFDAQGGNCDTASKGIVFSDYYGSLPTPTKNGHEFNGWNTKADGSGTMIKSSDIYNVVGNSTVYAVWTPDVYTITLDNQNAGTEGTAAYYEKYGIGNYMEYSCSKAISKITVPSKTGYVFKGYYTGKGGEGTCYVDDGGKILSTNTTFTSDTLLYAYWEPNTYTIKYDANGGEGTMENTPAVYDVYAMLSPNTFEKTGYSFAGWAAEPDGAVVYEDKDSVMNLTSKNGATVTLYAVWEADSYTVIYDYWSNGGTSASLDNATVTYGTDIDLTVTAEKDTYTFVGWNTDPNATTGLSSLTMSTENVTLYAIFKKEIVITIVERIDEGTVTRELQTTIYNNQKDADFLIEQENTWSGWKMLGWTASKDAGAYPEIGLGIVYTASDSITFYALYSQDVTVSYDTNGSEVTIESQTKERFYNASDTFLNPIFTLAASPELSQHSFVEWVDTDGNGYAADSDVAFEKDTLLTAKWDKHPEIEAYDRYFTLEQAQNGEITEEELLKKVVGTDLEDGVLVNGTNVVVKDYDASIFKDLDNDKDINIYYQATDSFGNVVEKIITIYVVDTTITESPSIYYSRFISADYYSDGENLISEEKGGLKETSLWRTKETYNRLLESVLFNAKTNEEYKKIEYFGLDKEVKTAGSGTWERIEETWVFTKADLKAVEEFTLEHGLGNLKESDAIEKFFELFGVCIEENE